MKKTESLIREASEVFLFSTLGKHVVESGEEKRLKETDLLTLKV